jgi:hypothetical protein
MPSSLHLPADNLDATHVTMTLQIAAIKGTAFRKTHLEYGEFFRSVGARFALTFGEPTTTDQIHANWQIDFELAGFVPSSKTGNVKKK